MCKLPNMHQYENFVFTEIIIQKYIQYLVELTVSVC